MKRKISSLHFMSNSAEVDMAKIQELAMNNSTQVTKTTVKESGDVNVDLTSTENRKN